MRQIKLFLLVAVFFCQSCAAQPLDITAAPSSVVVEETPEMPTPDMIVDPMKQRGQVVTVLVGDVFAVALPQGSSKWKVDYADSVVEPLTPAENMREPGPRGWLFRAVAAGQTDIRLTAPAAACNQPPCPPPSPITFVFTVEVK
jgi:hypothetical protein